MKLPFVDKNMIGAVHRSQLITFVFNFHLIKHILLVEVKVAADLPKISFCHVGRVEKLITPMDVYFLPGVFN